MNEVDFASYADDNTPYVIGNGVNPDKRLLLASSNEEVSICVGNCNIKSSKCVKF